MFQPDERTFAQENDTSRSLSDTALVALAKNGDNAAYVELCRRHSPMALRTILRITKNREDAEDVLQDTLMRALVHLNTFDARALFSTWLTRIAVNSSLMLLRKKRTRREISIDHSCSDKEWQVFQVADPSLNPEGSYRQVEREARLRQAIRRLPSPLRSVMEIRYSQEASVKEVAARAEISLPAAKSRLLRANIALRMSMKQSYLSRKGIVVVSKTLWGDLFQFHPNWTQYNRSPGSYKK